MTDYTPTTEDVREDFAYPWSADQIGDKTARLAAFDRWFAATIRDAKAEALREAAAWFVQHPKDTERTWSMQRVAHHLDAMATATQDTDSP